MRKRNRAPRTDGLARLVHPTVRFAWGLGLLACLVFAEGWQPRGVLAGLGLILALVSGKRVSFSSFAILIASVLFFNLLLPVGRVWFVAGPVAVTEGAFFLGLGKGLTFAGLVLISLASVSRDLKLPGSFGALWGQTFSWYEQLMDQRKALKPRALLLSVDRLLERLYPTRGARTAATPVQTRTATTAAGWALVGATLVGAVAVSVFWR